VGRGKGDRLLFPAVGCGDKPLALYFHSPAFLSFFNGRIAVAQAVAARVDTSAVFELQAVRR